jgi:hypothetical protein
LKSKLFKIEISDESETHLVVMFELNFWFVIVLQKKFTGYPVDCTSTKLLTHFTY